MILCENAIDFSLRPTISKEVLADGSFRMAPTHVLTDILDGFVVFHTAYD